MILPTPLGGSDLRSVAYTATPTNRVLIEARFGVRREEYAYTPTSTLDPQRLLIPVIEQGGAIPGLLYRGGGISSARRTGRGAGWRSRRGSTTFAAIWRCTWSGTRRR